MGMAWKKTSMMQREARAAVDTKMDSICREISEQQLHRGTKETIEEYLASGGRVQRLRPVGIPRHARH